MIATIIGIVLAALFSALVIFIVGKLNMGLEVNSFGAAFIAAIVIALVAGVINWLLGLLGINIGGGLLGGIVSLIIAAVVLMISDKFVSGMKVNGFGGAIIAAVAIGLVTWLISWLLGLLGIG
jgi:putative membrane protein